jgi:hypothetical protein
MRKKVGRYENGTDFQEAVEEKLEKAIKKAELARRITQQGAKDYPLMS